MTQVAPLKVSIIEDDPFLGPFLAKVVERSPSLRLCGLSVDGPSALERISHDHPEVVLMDLSVPRMKGHRLLKALREHAPDSQIVVLTGSDEPEKLLSALRAGAVGYLCKPSSPAEIVNAIHCAARHQHPLNERAARLVRKSRLDRPAGPSRDWSRREMQVLESISEGLSNEEVAAQMGISIETVRSHLKRVYRKLGVRSRVEAAVVHLAAEKAEILAP